MPKKLRHTLAIAATLLLAAAPLRAQEAASDALDLFSAGEEEVVSTSRIPRPISRIAENVTVVTAEDIRRLNAHTLTEVLEYIPGLHLVNQRTPGSFTFFSVQGAMSEHVLVLIDGVPQNDLSDVQADVGNVPVQHIDRIEIIKGAASAAWGPALGGVVNVITKGPYLDRKFGGAGSTSIGSRGTTDAVAELGGTVNRFGYYLSGGNLHSNGLLPVNQIDNDHLSGKLHYDLPEKGTLTFGASYRDTARGEFEAPTFNFSDTSDITFVYGYLTFAYPLGDALDLEVTARNWHRNFEYWGRNYTDNVLTYHPTNSENVRGINSKLTWGDSLNNLVVGLEYEHAKISQKETFYGTDFDSRTMDRFGAFLNGAVSIGRLTLLPGIRLDDSGLGTGDYLSYTAGATYRITDRTFLRGYGARGYTLPGALLDHGLQKVWTAQAGVETGDIPGIWLKGTFFYNDTSNIETQNPETWAVELTEQIKQGMELEALSNKVCGFSVAGGYTYVHARDRRSGDRLRDIPGHLLKLALRYDSDRWGVSGTLTGNYAWINADPAYNPADGTFIWDLHLSKKLMQHELSPELFFSARNLFNGSQYWSDHVKNPRRWIEGGVRFSF